MMEDCNNYPQNNNQEVYNSPVTEEKSNKKNWLLILIPVFVILTGVILFLFMSLSLKTISDDEFSQGTNVQLKENAEAKFIIDDDEHTIKIDSIGSGSVTLTIQSNPIQVNLKIGETKKFDLNDDGFYDVQVKLNNLENNVPEIFIKKIHESTYIEDWSCGNWSECSEQGNQTRTCTDLNDCGTVKEKPATTQSCIYVETCIEDWECGNWDWCDCGERNHCEQTRICTDLNDCGTVTNKPVEKQDYWKPMTTLNTEQNKVEKINTEITLQSDKTSDINFLVYKKIEHFKDVSLKPIYYKGAVTYFADNKNLYKLENNNFEKIDINNIINFRNQKAQELNLDAKAFDYELFDYIITDTIKYYLFNAGIIKEENDQLTFIEKPSELFGKEIIIDGSGNLWLLNSPVGAIDIICQYLDKTWISHKKQGDIGMSPSFITYNFNKDMIFVEGFEEILYFKDNEWISFYEYTYPEFHFLENFIVKNNDVIALDYSLAELKVYFIEDIMIKEVKTQFEIPSDYYALSPSNLFIDENSLWLFSSDYDELIRLTS